MTTSMHARYQTNKQAENEGIEFTGFEGGAAFTLRSARALSVRTSSAMMHKRLRQSFLANGNQYSPADQDLIAVEEAVAVTAGWRNVADEAGKPLPFSLEAARTLYTELPILREQVLGYARTDELYLASTLESTAGN